MRKSTKLLKRFVALFLVVLMSINSFAAIVGDNDGAAFITKDEFESLKSEFSSQIDRYNNSLDNKIDGKIATYLAGLRVSKKSYKRSSLEVAGQTYLGASRKSYVFAGNDSPNWMTRYNTAATQFHLNYVRSWNVVPELNFWYRMSFWTEVQNSSKIDDDWYGSDEAWIKLFYRYHPVDDDGNDLPCHACMVFVVDKNNYVVTYKIDASLYGDVMRNAWSTTNNQYINCKPFFADATHPWRIQFKDVVNAGGTNGMGYSTRLLNDREAALLNGYLYRFGVNNSDTQSGMTYMNKTVNDRGGHTYYIMNYGSGTTEPYPITLDNLAAYVTWNQWYDHHLHFDESRFGENYAWCMPFGHLLPDRKAACFSQWPAWESVIWKTFDEVSVGSIDATSDKLIYDTSGVYSWKQDSSQASFLYQNGISRTYFDKYEESFKDYLNIRGMLPVWKENPLKDWRLLKNRNIKNALGVEAYYAAAPPLTEEFQEPGSITWVAKISQEDLQRIPGRTWDNWGINRIYFTSKPMDDIEYSGTDVKVSNTKKFQYKKHGTTDSWADCQSQVIDGKTYYYQTLDHDTYYDFMMDVDSRETVYYMIFDEKRPSDYCLEVIEHPDYQIEFTAD